MKKAKLLFMGTFRTIHDWHEISMPSVPFQPVSFIILKKCLLSIFFSLFYFVRIRMYRSLPFTASHYRTTLISCLPSTFFFSFSFLLLSIPTFPSCRVQISTNYCQPLPVSHPIYVFPIFPFLFSSLSNTLFLNCRLGVCKSLPTTTNPYHTHPI